MKCHDGFRLQSSSDDGKTVQARRWHLNCVRHGVIGASSHLVLTTSHCMPWVEEVWNSQFENRVTSSYVN